MPLSRNRLLWLPLTVALFATLIGCQVENEYKAPPPPPVAVTKPISRSVLDYLTSTGTTEAVERVEIRARVQGFLEDITFKPGDMVEEGQLLFVIEKAPFQSAVDQAAADVVVAQAQMADAKSKYERAVPLAAKQAVTEEELQELKALYAVALAQIDAAKARLARAQLDLGYTDVKSLIAGRVGKNLIDKGSLVGGLNATKLATIVKYDPIYVNFTISEPELNQIIATAPRDESGEIKGEEVPVEIALDHEEGYPHVGELDFADLGVESSTGTFMLRGVIDNAKGLLTPGMYARVRLTPPGMKPRSVLLVPEKSIGSDQQGKFVKVLGSESKIERAEVETGVRLGEWRVIESGLKADAEVVYEGLQRARVGGLVTRMDEDKTPPVPTAPPES